MCEGQLKFTPTITVKNNSKKPHVSKFQHFMVTKRRFRTKVIRKLGNQRIEFYFFIFFGLL